MNMTTEQVKAIVSTREFYDGITAYNQDCSQNPHPPGSRQARSWQVGWTAAEADDIDYQRKYPDGHPR